MHPSRRRRRTDSAPEGVERADVAFSVPEKVEGFNLETRVNPVFDEVFESDAIHIPCLRESHDLIKRALSGEVVEDNLISYIAETYPDIVQCRPDEVSAPTLGLLRSRPGSNRYIYCDCSAADGVDRGNDEWLYHVQSINKGENLLISRVQWFNGKPYHDPLSITASEIEKVSVKYSEVLDFSRNPVEFFKGKIKKKSSRKM